MVQKICRYIICPHTPLTQNGLKLEKIGHFFHDLEKVAKN